MTGRGWPFPSFVLGIPGFVIGCVWLIAGREPSQRNEISNRRTPVPWTLWARSRSTWALVLSYGVAAYRSP